MSHPTFVAEGMMFCRQCTGYNEYGVKFFEIYPCKDALRYAVRELTRQLEGARNIAVRCGAFETWTGTDVETYVER